MRIAKHPSLTHFFTVEEYNRRGLDRAYCVVCRAQVFARAKHSTPHFYHKSGSNCPTTQPRGRPYLDLRPTRPDLENERWLKSCFKGNWERHYARIASGPDRLIPFLSVEEFLLMLDRANELRIFAYRDIREQDIPYFMALLIDFPPWTGYKRDGVSRKRYFRFFFDSDASTSEQLWIDGTKPENLLRASYYISDDFCQRQRRPEMFDFADPVHICMTPDFLQGEYVAPHEFIRQKVERWFNKHPSF